MRNTPAKASGMPRPSPIPARTFGQTTLSTREQAPTRAMFRTAAELGGHSTLVMRGMMEPDIELAVRTENGRPVVVEGRNGKILKSKGGSYPNQLAQFGSKACLTLSEK